MEWLVKIKRRWGWDSQLRVSSRVAKWRVNPGGRGLVLGILAERRRGFGNTQLVAEIPPPARKHEAEATLVNNERKWGFALAFGSDSQRF